MMLRRILFVLLAAVTPALGLVFAKPAMADPVITSTFDTEEAHPGDTVTLNITFTNPETADVTFTYLSINWTWDMVNDGTKFSRTSCTGEISLCSVIPPAGTAMNFAAPIAPGASRTATVTYQIAADTPCGAGKNLSFFFYDYRESSAGAFDLIANSPVVNILC